MAYFTIEGYDSYSGCDITVTASLPVVNDKQPSKYYVLGSLQTLSISTHQDKRPVRSLGVVNAKDYVMGPRTIAGSMVFAVFNKHFASEIMSDLGATGSDVVLPDEIPALNITVNFANEYGRMSRMAIYGVKIINEGQVMSINDLYTENTYQFVAIGLEPLNVSINESSGMTKNSSSLVITPSERLILDLDRGTWKGTTRLINPEDLSSIKPTNRKVLDSDNNIFPQYTDDWSPSLLPHIPSKIVANEINNNRILRPEEKDIDNSFILKDIITLQADTERLITKFTLNPHQDRGTILISNKNSAYDSDDVFLPGEGNDINNSTGIIGTVNPILKNYSHKIDVANKKNYVISLPPGEYSAQFESPSYEYSNIVDFTTSEGENFNISQNKEVYPFIDKLTNDYALISNGNYSHNNLNYILDGGVSYNENIGKKPVKITGLHENSDYTFFTNLVNTRIINSMTNRSELVSCKTHKINEPVLNMFKDFIISNENLLISNKEDLLKTLEGYDYDDYLSLIDLVLSMPDSICKQELLIYANILNKQLIDSYNKNNKYIITDKLIETPFSTTLKMYTNKKSCIYLHDNYKKTLETTLDSIENEFCFKYNKHYSIQTVSNGVKSVKYDFATCGSKYYDDLKNYCLVDQYKTVSLDSYLETYNTYDYGVVQAIAIKNNCFCDQNILREPYVYEEQDAIIVDVNYLNLENDKDYYLVCSELYSALDYVPKRKIKFNSKTPIINLNNHYLGLHKDKKYLFWIENDILLRISNSYLFSYNSDPHYVQLMKLERKELDRLLSQIKNDLIYLIDNKLLITDLINFVYSLHPARKNLESELIIQFIKFFQESYTINNMLLMLYYLLSIIHSSRKINSLNAQIIFNPNNRSLKVTCDEEYYVCAIHYDSNECYRLNESNNVTYEEDGYTLLYLVHKRIHYQSGFILIENKTGEYMTNDDMTNIIKKVGGK